MEKPIYKCACRGNQFAVLEWKYTPRGDSATTVDYFPTIQLAKRKAKELNLSHLLSLNKGLF